MHNLKPWAGALYPPSRFFMRTRKQIEQDGARKDILILECVLDCRSLLEKLVKAQSKQRKASKRGKDSGTSG